ncbi:T9SS type A sorting domain-containing protein, partial [Fulvivirga sp. RKSG066]|uniref:T9SS type A sorting domain-containing protein n=1 Tax=Fulvivirga aurantia TaxID=2529383 RepID=UPI0012BD3B0B
IFVNIDNNTDFNNLNGATWNYEGSTYDPDTRLFTSNGINDFNYTRSGMQDIIVPQDNYSNITLTGSDTKTSQGNLDVNGDLTISGSAQLNVDTGNDNITFAGNWINTSTNADPFVEGQETVTFDAGATQTITNMNGESFYNLTINKSGGVVNLASGSNVVVSNTLDMTAGNIDISDQNLTITSTGNIVNGSVASYVLTSGNGELIQQNLGAGGRTGAVSYPVGRFTNSYTPLIVDNSSGVADDFGIRVCSNVYEEGGCETGTLVSDLILDRTWFISEGTAGGSSADITFQWNAANEVGSFNRADMNIIHYNGSIWEKLAEGIAASGTGPYMATIPGVNDFSPFTIEDGASPLPVSLVKFEATPKNGKVEVNWVTASEINNDYFIIERGANTSSFEEIGIVEGNGTTNQTMSYDFKDNMPFGGTSYYRLTQVDFDGTSEVFEPVKVTVPLTGQLEAFVYPIPSEGDFINLQLSGFDKSLTAEVKIVDVKGEVVHLEEIFLDKDTGFNQKINFSKQLKAGIYILNVTTPTPVVKRIMIK